jgi:hypothetical protein
MPTNATSTVSLDELEEKFLTIGQHVDQILLSSSTSFQSAFSSRGGNNDLNTKLEMIF